MSGLNWIPVTDRLPDSDITVLVWTRGGEWFAAWYDDQDTGWRDGCTTVQMQGDNEVTHWAEPQGPGAALAEQPAPEWKPVPPRACIKPTHEAADAFWKYWRKNGETHKHGYYESTWGAINAALAHGYTPPLAEQLAAPVVLTGEDLRNITRSLPPADCDRLTAEWRSVSMFARAVLAAAIPPGCVMVSLEKLESLRFVQRVLESDAPQADRDAAAQMVRDLRAALAARPGGSDDQS